MHFELPVKAAQVKGSLDAGSMVATLGFPVERGGFNEKTVAKHRDGKKHCYLENTENIAPYGKLAAIHMQVFIIINISNLKMKMKSADV